MLPVVVLPKWLVALVRETWTIKEMPAKQRKTIKEISIHILLNISLTQQDQQQTYTEKKANVRLQTFVIIAGVVTSIASPPERLFHVITASIISIDSFVVFYNGILNLRKQEKIVTCHTESLTTNFATLLYFYNHLTIFSNRT